jgi:hypothetical protein
VFKHHPQQFGQSSWHSLSLEQPQNIPGGILLITFTNATLLTPKMDDLGLENKHFLNLDKKLAE